MDLEQRVRALEQEVQVLKAQIQTTLLDIQEQLLNNSYNALRAEDTTPSARQPGGDGPTPVKSPNGTGRSAEPHENAESKPIRRFKLDDSDQPEPPANMVNLGIKRLHGANTSPQVSADRKDEASQPNVKVRQIIPEQTSARTSVPSETSDDADSSEDEESAPQVRKFTGTEAQNKTRNLHQDEVQQQTQAPSSAPTPPFIEGTADLLDSNEATQPSKKALKTLSKSQGGVSNQPAAADVSGSTPEKAERDQAKESPPAFEDLGGNKAVEKPRNLVLRLIAGVHTAGINKWKDSDHG